MGRCKTFDSSADGYGRGEGFISTLMQRTQVSSNGQPFAIILGSAINHAGCSSGLTAPNGPAQAALIRTALATSQTAASAVQYLSLHGTGTPLGDPIEVGALVQVLCGSKASLTRAMVSNKSCYGHTEGAAGITGVLLAGCAINHRTVPATMHLRSMNPYVEATLGLENRNLIPRGSAPGSSLGSVAGSSSFGMSGVNAHMLVSQSNVAQSSRDRSSTWQRERLWPLAPGMHLLDQARDCTTNRAVLSVCLAKPALSNLWGHQVRYTKYTQSTGCPAARSCTMD